MRLKKHKEEKDPWPPIKTKSYVTLAFVHQKELQTRQETTATIYLRTKGDIHKIPHTIDAQKLTDITQIFDPVSGRVPNSILIEGHAGIGKTTLVKEICTQWAEDKLLTSDKLVLLLLLRDPNVQKITKEHKLIEHFTSYLTTELYNELVKNHGVGVTLIIDGFDELTTELRHESFFRELIEKTSLPKAKIVVTSRPSASACIHDVVDKRIEILGFEQSSKNQYVTEALQDYPSKLEKLQRHFQQHPNIDAICYIPLIMSIIVFLCMCQPDELPPTATKMYASFILHTICHYLKRVGKIPDDKIINKLEQFPPVVYTTLQDLEKTAFDGLVEDKIVFTVEELPVFCWHDPTCYGLLQSTECYSAEEIGTPTQSFNFLHLGVQEYFAAKYVITLPEDQVYRLLKESFIDTESKHSVNPESKSVRFSNMWILYCGITSGRCKTLRHYLTTYVKPHVKPDDYYCSDSDDNGDDDYRDYNYDDDKMLPPTFDDHMTLHFNPHKQQLDSTLSPSTTSMLSQRFHPLQSSSINPSYHPVTPPTQPVYSRYLLTPSRGQHITSYPHPHHLPTVYHSYQQQQQLVQYPYHQPSMTDRRSHDPMSHPEEHSALLTTHVINDGSHDHIMHNPSMVVPHSSHNPTLPERYSTTTTSKHVNNNIDSQVTSDKMTGPYQQGSNCDQRISNTGTISKDILKDSVKILYLFQCFQEAQNDVLCEVLSKSFDDGVIDINSRMLLPHLVVSLGFFLSRSHRKWKELNLSQCHFGDHGMSILHQYLCGDKTNKQEIKSINLGYIDLTGASSHLIGDIISHLQPHTLWLQGNNITNVRDISTAVIATSTVKVLDMRNNDLTAQEAISISDMICLEEFYIANNNLGAHGAELLSEGITNTKTLRVLNIGYNNIGPSGTTAIANALSNNTSLETLDMKDKVAIGQDETTTIAKAIINNKTLKRLSLGNTVEKVSAMIIMRSLHCNNTITKLELSIKLRYDVSIRSEGIKINNRRNECNVEKLTVVY